MFEHYARSQKRSGINWPVFGGVIALLVVGGYVALRLKERHDIAEMNSVFAGAGEVPLAARGEPARVELPGMSIEAPAAFAITGDYDEGAATAGHWTIKWTPNVKLAAADDVPKQVKFIAERTASRAGPIQPIQVGGAPGYLIEFDGDVDTAMIISTCGQRSLQIVSASGVRAMTRAAESFRCTPHPGRLVQHSAAVAPREGWRVMPDRITTELTNDQVQVLLLAARENSPSLAIYSRAFDLAPAVEQHGAYTIRRGVVHRSDNAHHPGALVTWPCPALDATGYAFISQLGASGLEEGIALAETGRCLTADEPAPVY